MRLLQLACNLLGGSHGARRCLLSRSGRQDATSGALHARLLLLRLLLTWIGCCSLLLWFVCDCSSQLCCSRIQRTLHFLAARGARSPHSMRTMMLHLAQTTTAELARWPSILTCCRGRDRMGRRGTYTQRCAAHMSTGSAWFPLVQSCTSSPLCN